MPDARITSFLVKVASRCNLDCDYCYVYHHADQGWRSMPRLLSEQHRREFAVRLGNYAASAGLSRVAVIFHGGEPLLSGPGHLVAFGRMLREAVGSDVELDLGLQTNGLLLTDEALDLFEAENIAVSLSMDGPRHAQDLHRRSRKGRSSYDRVQAALERLKRRPKIFAGVIAVIDPAVPPRDLLSFFADHRIPKVDFLLPDSSHDRLPPGRVHQPSLYENWLIGAFDLWLDEFPHLPVRTFEALLDAAAGLPSVTDAFGFGDVSLLSVETDGSWHDLDVFKVAGSGASRLFGTVSDTSIEDILVSGALDMHRRLLRREGLSSQCQACEVVEVCGGGSVPHRARQGSFEHPSIYCRELKSLIGHVRQRLFAGLAEHQPAKVQIDIDLTSFELAERSAEVTRQLYELALAEDASGFLAAAALAGMNSDEKLSDRLVSAAARRAGSVAWQRALRAQLDGRVVRDVRGHAIEVSPDYLSMALDLAEKGERLEIGKLDPWLRYPFGQEILFESEEVAARGRRLVEEALGIIERWRSALAAELHLICSAVQFVRDPSAHPDKIVSFSDDSVPGALFVSIVQGEDLIDPYDLADSLVHEYRHQKLYLLERLHPTTTPGALVVSPWREDLRPASGLLHAAFVFVELRRFWQHVRHAGPARLSKRAEAQLADTEQNLRKAFATLRNCSLTPLGRDLADLLEISSMEEQTLALV